MHRDSTSHLKSSSWQLVPYLLHIKYDIYIYMYIFCSSHKISLWPWFSQTAVSHISLPVHLHFWPCFLLFLKVSLYFQYFLLFLCSNHFKWLHYFSLSLAYHCTLSSFPLIWIFIIPYPSASLLVQHSPRANALRSVDSCLYVKYSAMATAEKSHDNGRLHLLEFMSCKIWAIKLHKYVFSQTRQVQIWWTFHKIKVVHQNVCSNVQHR